MNRPSEFSRFHVSKRQTGYTTPGRFHLDDCLEIARLAGGFKAIEEGNGPFFGTTQEAR
jgi:hypothetical protein